jgi:RNA polymerase sigma factor (sigma-70 family)
MNEAVSERNVPSDYSDGLTNYQIFRQQIQGLERTTREDIIALCELRDAGNAAALLLDSGESKLEDLPSITEAIIDGDAAIKRMIEGNMGLLSYFAQMHALRKRFNHPIEEATQDASIGLMKAAKTFDPTRGTAFSTHAGWCINKEISLGVANALGLPQHMEAIPKVQVKAYTAPDSLDSPISGENGEGTLSMGELLLTNDRFDNPEVMAEITEQIKIVNIAITIANIKPTESLILAKRLLKGKDIIEIADEMGIPHKEVQTTYTDIIRRIRNALRGNALRDRTLDYLPQPTGNLNFSK